MLPPLVTSLTLLSFVQAAPAAIRSSVSQVAAAWYAGWHATEGYPLSAINWGKYNTMYYSFA